MDRRTFIKTGAGAAGAVLLVSCAGNKEPQVGKPVPPSDVTVPASRVTLRQHIDEGAGLPLPFAYSPQSYGMMTYLFDSLLLIDSTGAVIPWLASSYNASPDGFLHDFELRENARWHDGKPVTPDDVAFTFDYFQSQLDKLPPFVLYRPEGIADVRATGPRGVQIRLQKPQVNFARDILATFPIAPKHVWSGVGEAAEAQDLKFLVGSGPYRLDKYNDAQSTYLFVANDDFYLGKPFVKRLEYKPVGDPPTALLAKEIDTADFGVQGATPQALNRFKRDPSFGILEGALDFAAVLYFDQTKAGPMQDIRFRKACALGIDRKKMVRRVLGGLGAPGNPGFLPEGHPYRTEVEQYEYDPKAANRLLDEAGFKKKVKGVRQGPDGKPLSFLMAVTPEVEAAVQLVQADLKELGIRIELKIVDPFMLFSGQPLETDLALYPHGGMRQDPDFMRVVFSSRYERRFFAPKGYSNAELDDLADRQRETLDEAQRRQLLARMQEIVAADLPYLHLYYERDYSMFRKEVFDQWSTSKNGGPSEKDTLVTGTKAGGTEIRPIRE